ARIPARRPHQPAHWPLHRDHHRHGRQAHPQGAGAAGGVRGWAGWLVGWFGKDWWAAAPRAVVGLEKSKPLKRKDAKTQRKSKAIRIRHLTQPAQAVVF